MQQSRDISKLGVREGLEVVWGGYLYGGIQGHDVPMLQGYCKEASILPEQPCPNMHCDHASLHLVHCPDEPPQC